MVRNRRRTIYAVLGITLAVSLIAGSLIAVDSASVGLIRERLEDIPVDYYGQSYVYLQDVDTDRYDGVTDRPSRGRGGRAGVVRPERRRMGLLQRGGLKILQRV